MVLISDQTEVFDDVQTLSPQQVMASLLALPNFAQRQFIEHITFHLNRAAQDAVANLLKEKSDYFLRSNIQTCLQIADLLCQFGQITQNDWYLALGFRAKANAFAYGGLGEYQEAITFYDQAAEIYKAQNHLVNQAGCHYAKLMPLAHLGRYDEAKEAGEWARKILLEHGEWLLLAKVKVNLGLVYLRLGDDAKALDLFDRAKAIYLKHSAAIDTLGRVENNRSIALRNLGLFQQSIEVIEEAVKLLEKSGQVAEIARTQQTLGITYFILGHYNEGLELLNKAQAIFLSDGRHRDAILIELYISDCLLQLGRYTDVLENFQKIRHLFARLGAQFEVAQCLLNEAVAHAGLRHYEPALTALHKAKRIFRSEGNAVWAATADLEMASICLLQGKLAEALSLSLTCLTVFEAHNLRVPRAHALLLAARAELQTQAYEQAEKHASCALAIGTQDELPLMIYQAQHLLGQLAREKADYPQARARLEKAIIALEQLRGRLMLEFRSDFLLDKHLIYEEMVQLCLQMNEPTASLHYAERAKSRVLLEMLAFRLDIGIQVRAPEDEAVVAELTRLRAERDSVYRRWVSTETSADFTDTILASEQKTAQKKVQQLEKRITSLWHNLLIRNADYTTDAALWQIQAESVQPRLDAETVLLEFFVAKGELIVFVITGETVAAYPLPSKPGQIQQLMQLFWLNLNAVPHSSPQRIGQLSSNAQGILRQLYNALLAGVAELLHSCKKLIIIPHGFLHYLPFHALYGPNGPLLTEYEISYLPSTNFIQYGRTHTHQNGQMVAVGNSYHGALPFAIQEATAIGNLWSGNLLLEEAATLANIKEAAQQGQIVHLATHADFRPDNPLFSGLALADGWLTTLDIFNLKLNASLVTLSACQTGRSVISGGDELLGLMRAFLASGASSLALTLWPVEDQSTAVFMQNFYANLLNGRTKGDALRQAQLNFLNTGEQPQNPYQHPYFWAPFFLVGHAGKL